jgi:hypothetical protein
VDVIQTTEAVWNVISALIVIIVDGPPFTLLYFYTRLRSRISGYAPYPRTQAGLRLTELAAPNSVALISATSA